MNILFTSAGRRVELVQLFRQALKTCGLNGRLLTADLHPSAPAHRISDLAISVPPVTSPEYVARLYEICKKESISLLVPLIDTELHLLAPHHEAFAEIGTTLLLSSPEVTRIGLDKRDTHAFFVHNKIDTPSLFALSDILDKPEAYAFPMLMKPAKGSSSKGVTKIATLEELSFFARYLSEPIIQPLLRGKEYTLDILADRQGQVCCVVPRLRIDTRSGEISKGITVKDDRLMRAGKHLVERLPGAWGPITAQCFMSDTGEISFIEINPRFGGGFPLSAAAGADFPSAIIRMVQGQSPGISNDDWKDGVSMLRYDAAFYGDASWLLA